jgi:hypothetical protein
MIYFLALLPATALTIAGYFVLFLSARSQGALRTFGRYLGFWAFTLAGLLILGAIFAAAHGRHHCPVFGMHGMHERMHERMHGAWPPGEERPEVGPPADTSQTPPAPGAAANPTGAPTSPPPAAR